VGVLLLLLLLLLLAAVLLDAAATAQPMLLEDPGFRTCNALRSELDIDGDGEQQPPQPVEADLSQEVNTMAPGYVF
jgi:hypothetical protein